MNGRHHERNEKIWGHDLWHQPKLHARKLFSVEKSNQNYPKKNICIEFGIPPQKKRETPFHDHCARTVESKKRCLRWAPLCPTRWKRILGRNGPKNDPKGKSQLHMLIKFAWGHTQPLPILLMHQGFIHPRWLFGMSSINSLKGCSYNLPPPKKKLVNNVPLKSWIQFLEGEKKVERWNPISSCTTSSASGLGFTENCKTTRDDDDWNTSRFAHFEAKSSFLTLSFSRVFFGLCRHGFKSNAENNPEICTIDRHLDLHHQSWYHGIPPHQIGVSLNGDTPKMDGENNGKSY